MSLVAVYLGVAGVAFAGLVQTMRSQARSRNYLESTLEDEVLDLSHLSAPLANLVIDARAIRSSLDGPQRFVDRMGRMGTLGSDAEELDSQLREVSRELGDWLAGVERLPEQERVQLGALSSNARELATLFGEENFALERHVRRGQRPLKDTLVRVREHLIGLERDLQRAQDPYR